MNSIKNEWYARVTEGKGNLLAYIYDTAENAITSAETFYNSLTEYDKKETKIEAVEFDLEKAIEEAISNGYAEDVEEGIKLFTGKNGTEINYPFEAIMKTLCEF